jgi:cephalosporin-C deacetylase-like acetyl esterase
VRNSDLHRDLEIDTVDVYKEVKRFAREHEDRLHQHTSVEALQLLDNSDIVKRLNRVKPFELV